jgi:Leucine-rich repeat (LRR) protein
LDNNQLSTTEIHALMNELSHVDLDLDIMSLKNTGISNFTPCHIFTSLGLGRFHKITYLIISSNNLSDTAASLLSRILTEGKMSSTKTIDISNNKITDVGVKYSTDALQSYTVNNLEYLNLSNNKITDKGASTIAEALEYGKSNNLLKFDISGNNITEAGWEYFATAVKKVEARTVAEKIILQTMENERILTLDKISLKNIDMQHLADTLKPINYNLDAILLQNKNLNNLDFFHLMNGITLPNIGISHSVVYINLANNNLGDDAAQIISGAIVGEQLTATSVIDVSRNKITEAGQDFFVRALNDPIVKRLAILIDDLSHNLRIQSGIKEDVVAELHSILKSAKNRGVDVDNIVVDTSFLTWVKNTAGAVRLASTGFIKCKWTDDPIGDHAKADLCDKLPDKIGKPLKKNN